MKWHKRDWWRYIVSLDVESLGLHGEGFAVGAVVFRDGIEVESFYHRCQDPDAALLKVMDPSDSSWVRENVLPVLDSPTLGTAGQVREAFWKWWLVHQEEGAVLVTDVPWPVEANFLSACIRGNILERKWQGPYPIIDVASVLVSKGWKRRDRKADELPEHNPVTDARYSGRLLLEVLGRLG